MTIFDELGRLWVQWRYRRAQRAHNRAWHRQQQLRAWEHQ